MGIVGNAPVGGGAPSLAAAGSILTDVTGGGTIAAITGRRVNTLHCHALTGVPNDILAIIVDEGRTALAQTLANGLSFHLTHFAVGTDGYDTATVQSVTTATAPALLDTALGAQVFPIIPLLEPIDMYQLPNPQAMATLCRIEPTEGVAPLGEIGVWATVLDQGTAPVPFIAGYSFMFALAHFPLQAKTIKHTYLYRLIYQF